MVNKVKFYTEQSKKLLEQFLEVAPPEPLTKAATLGAVRVLFFRKKEDLEYRCPIHLDSSDDQFSPIRSYNFGIFNGEHRLYVELAPLA